MTTPQDIIQYLLPFVATAGGYSAYVQHRVGTHAAKDGATTFHHALSDADLTIQSYLEVVLLARFPTVSFFSEEGDQSLNVKYFPENSPLEVLLDPIDGTRSYIDNRTHYQVIVTIHDDKEIVGALCYQPRLNRCYIATKNQGAYVLTHDEAIQGLTGTRLEISHATGPVLVFNRPDLVEKISPHLETRDIVTEYAITPGRYNSTDLLVRGAIAHISAPCQAIDGGAISFIAQEAGAIVSDFQGNPMGNYRASPKRTLPEIIAASTPKVHETILRAVQQNS